jgi:hypothetical protein
MCLGTKWYHYTKLLFQRAIFLKACVSAAWRSSITSFSDPHSLYADTDPVFPVNTNSDLMPVNKFFISEIPIASLFLK